MGVWMNVCVCAGAQGAQDICDSRVYKWADSLLAVCLTKMLTILPVLRTLRHFPGQVLCRH